MAEEIGSSFAGLHSLDLDCLRCGETTRHRVLHTRTPGPSSDRRPTSIEGTARCQVCHTVRHFAVSGAPEVRVSVILSEGASSTRRWVPFARGRPLSVGGIVTLENRPVRIVRLDTTAGSREHCQASEAVTLWTVPDDYVWLSYAVTEGSKTRSLRARVRADQRIEVGGVVDLEGARFRVWGFRAGSRTLRRPGESGLARNISRVYLRPIVNPPGGRRDWSRSRGSPNRRESSLSSRSRSRSSPGLRSTRTSEPARENASGGAH
jgi:uncharacterized Zn finger protein